MKKLIILFSILLVLASCSSQTYVYQDDLYYNPNDTTKIIVENNYYTNSYYLNDYSYRSRIILGHYYPSYSMWNTWDYNYWYYNNYIWGYYGNDWGYYSYNHYHPYRPRPHIYHQPYRPRTNTHYGPRKPRTPTNNSRPPRTGNTYKPTRTSKLPVNRERIYKKPQRESKTYIPTKRRDNNPRVYDSPKIKRYQETRTHQPQRTTRTYKTRQSNRPKVSTQKTRTPQRTTRQPTKRSGRR